MLKLKNIRNDQRGATAIFVTISIVFILMLVALTYTYLTANSYAEVVDNQQNLQATYGGSNRHQRYPQLYSGDFGGL